MTSCDTFSTPALADPTPAQDLPLLPVALRDPLDGETLGKQVIGDSGDGKSAMIEHNLSVVSGLVKMTDGTSKSTAAPSAFVLKHGEEGTPVARSAPKLR